MTETRAAYVAAAIINPEDLRDAVVCMAQARRRALLLELTQLEQLLCISPTTRDLRREQKKWRGSEQTVRLKD